MGSVTNNVLGAILELLSGTAALVRETNDGPLANATADVLKAIKVDMTIGQREDLVYQTIMRSLMETGALGVGVFDLAHHDQTDPTS